MSSRDVYMEMQLLYERSHCHDHTPSNLSGGSNSKLAQVRYDASIHHTSINTPLPSLVTPALISHIPRIKYNMQSSFGNFLNKARDTAAGVGGQASAMLKVSSSSTVWVAEGVDIKLTINVGRIK